MHAMLCSCPPDAPVEAQTGQKFRSQRRAFHVERRRRTDRAAILGLTRRLPGLFATRATPVAVGRSLGLTALNVFPDLRRQFARLLMFGVRS